MQIKTTSEIAVGKVLLLLQGSTLPDTDGLDIYYCREGSGQFTPDKKELRQIVQALRKERTGLSRTHATLLGVFIDRVQYQIDLLSR